MVARAGDDADDDLGPGSRPSSGVHRAVLPRTPDELVRRSFAAWVLWVQPTLGVTGVLAAWRTLRPRERNAWRVAVAAARDEIPPVLEQE